MTNLLRNKTVVSCLAVIALLGVAANVLKFPFSVHVAAKVGRACEPDVPVPIAPSGAAEEKFDVPPQLAIRDELLSWAKTGPVQTSRDPFAWPQSAVAISTNAPAGPPPLFRLQAVSIEGEKVFAVLNQHVLSTGDKLGDYLVERILPREVWMHGPAGRIVVRLAR